MPDHDVTMSTCPKCGEMMAGMPDFIGDKRVEHVCKPGTRRELTPEELAQIQHRMAHPEVVLPLGACGFCGKEFRVGHDCWQIRAYHRWLTKGKKL